MINHPAYTVEPWCVRETELDLDVLEQAESMFALANGHIGLRGTLDEGEPAGRPGAADFVSVGARVVVGRSGIRSQLRLGSA